MSEGQATAGTRQSVLHRGGEKLSALVTQGKLWQDGCRCWWPAWWADDPDPDLCPEGSVGEGTAEADPLLQPLLREPLKHHP